MRQLQGLAEVLRFTPTRLVGLLRALLHDVLRQFSSIASHNGAVPDMQSPKTVYALRTWTDTEHLMRSMNLFGHGGMHNNALRNSKFLQDLLPHSVRRSGSAALTLHLVLRHLQTVHGGVLMLRGGGHFVQEFGLA